MKQKKLQSHMQYFPPEIIRNILRPLPVKSLIRLQCVCKLWKNLIKNPSFIADHLQLQQSSHQNPSLLLKCGQIYIALPWRFGRFQVGDVQRAPLNISLRAARFIGSCNGLICFELYIFNKSSPSFLLWNPATSAIRHVPETESDILFSRGSVTGFGFSEVVNDYKIVRIYDVGDEKDDRVEVFSLRRGTWEGIDLGNLKHVEPEADSVTVNNGAIFWFGEKQVSEEEGEDGTEGNTVVQVIVSFDIAKEVFTVIPRPDLDLSFNADEKLAVYENKLAILSVAWDVDDETPGWIDLWVLDEGTDASGMTGSWTKRYSSSPLSCKIDSVAIWGNEIVYISDSKEDNEEGRNVLCVMNVATNEVKRLSVPYCGSIHSIYNYMESLVSVGNN